MGFLVHSLRAEEPPAVPDDRPPATHPRGQIGSSLSRGACISRGFPLPRGGDGSRFASADHGRAELFVADFYQRLGEYLAERHASGYDAVAARARFLIWLGTHVDKSAVRPPRADPGGMRRRRSPQAARSPRTSEPALSGPPTRPSGRRTGYWRHTCGWSYRSPSGTAGVACRSLSWSKRAASA